MRRVIVSMNVSIDGFMAGANGELDWHFKSWDSDMAEALGEQLSFADTILLGANTYDAMARYWPIAEGDLSLPRDDVAFARMMNSHEKVVFSRTRPLPWNNARFIKRSARREVSLLKQQQGKDMIIFGSGALVASLSEDKLIDRYILWVHPVILSRGRPLFKNVDQKLAMKLVRMRKFRSGVVTLYYDVIEA